MRTQKMQRFQQTNQRVEEEEAEEPPLPLDDGEASSWLEEQEDDGQEEYRATEGHAEIEKE
jgi:hypothetical protein